jgi:hypothetical protein
VDCYPTLRQRQLPVRHTDYSAERLAQYESEINERGLYMTWAQGILFTAFIFIFFIGLTEGFND